MEMMDRDKRDSLAQQQVRSNVSLYTYVSQILPDQQQDHVGPVWARPSGGFPQGVKTSLNSSYSELLVLT